MVVIFSSYEYMSKNDITVAAVNRSTATDVDSKLSVLLCSVLTFF